MLEGDGSGPKPGEFRPLGPRLVAIASETASSTALESEGARVTTGKCFPSSVFLDGMATRRELFWL
ncbi:MAG: hypothetical protein Q8P12_04740, partial [bacterium]|nr:hypothetical protein [bacterium]